MNQCCVRCNSLRFRKRWERKRFKPRNCQRLRVATRINFFGLYVLLSKRDSSPNNGGQTPTCGENKNLHSNSNYSENFFLSEAFQQCLDYSLGSGSSVGGYKTNAYDGSSEYKEPAAEEYRGPVTADDIKEDYDYKAPPKKKRSRSGKKSKRDYKRSKGRYRR